MEAILHDQLSVLVVSQLLQRDRLLASKALDDVQGLGVRSKGFHQSASHINQLQA